MPEPRGDAEPTFSAALLRPMKRGLAACGISSDEFYGLIGIASEPKDTDRAPLHRVAAVLEMLARRTKTPHLALELARGMPVGALGSGDYTWSASSTLFHAMVRSQAYLERLTDALRFELHIDDGLASLVQCHVVDDHPRLMTELTSAMMVLRFRHVLGHAARFERVQFAHEAPGPTAPYDDFFGVKVEFGAADDRFVFPATLLQEPLLTSDPELARLLRAPRPPESPPPAADSLLARARTVLREALNRGDGDIDVALLAKRLDVSTRTLQRKLADEETSFSDLRDEARRELALELLDDETLLLADVAERLGFADLSAFHRAFRRWTGVSPRAFKGHPIEA